MSHDLLQVDVVDGGATVAVRLTGELDAETVGTLHEAVSGLDWERVEVVDLDCGALGFCGSAGLNEMARWRVDRQCVVRVHRASVALRRSIEVTGLDAVLELDGGDGEAAAAT